MFLCLNTLCTNPQFWYCMQKYLYQKQDFLQGNPLKCWRTCIEALHMWCYSSFKTLIISKKPTPKQWWKTNNERISSQQYWGLSTWNTVVSMAKLFTLLRQVCKGAQGIVYSSLRLTIPTFYQKFAMFMNICHFSYAWCNPSVSHEIFTFCGLLVGFQV